MKGRAPSNNPVTPFRAPPGREDAPRTSANPSTRSQDKEAASHPEGDGPEPGAVVRRLVSGSLARRTRAAQPVGFHPDSNEDSDADQATPGSPDDWGVVRDLALRHLDRFISLESRVLRDVDPEAVHDLRVASRRLQQVLDFLYPPVRDKEIRRLRRRVRRSRRILGALRDCDVLLVRVRKSLARKRTARRGAWEALEHHLLARRSELFPRAARRLGRLEMPDLYLRLKARLTAPRAPEPESPVPPSSDQRPERERSSGAAGDAGSGSSPELLPPTGNVGSARPEPPGEAGGFEELMAHRLKETWSAFDSRMDEAHRDPGALMIHRVRIAAKRLRYLIEVAQAFEISGAGDALVWLRSLQKQLGDWHDLEVMEQTMIDVLARADFIDAQLSTAMDLQKLIVRNRTSKKKIEESYREMTRQGVEWQPLRQWVTRTLASSSASGEP